MNTRFVSTTCSYCGTGCGVIHHVEDGRIVATLPNPHHPVNQGGLCIKGWNSHEHLTHRSRLTSPLVRQEGELRLATWEHALDTVAQGLAHSVTQYGPDSVAMLVSARATNEDNYLAQKFMRSVVGSNNVDHCARL